jgi:hypothetical protein
MVSLSKKASSRDRVGDFHRFSTSRLLLLLLNVWAMWATRLRCPSWSTAMVTRSHR